MAISNVSLTAGLGAATEASKTTGSKDLGQQQFMDLLIAQLRYQDPLSPVEGADFMGQTAQFSTLEGLNKLNTSITQMLNLQQLTQGTSLIGKKVTYSTGDAGVQTAVVNSVSMSNGKVQLQAGQDTVDLTQVKTVAAA